MAARSMSAPTAASCTRSGPAFVETIFVAGSALFFSQSGVVRRVDDGGAMATQTWQTTVSGASIPLAVQAMGAVFVGGDDGKLHQLTYAGGVDTAHAIES